MGNWNTSHTGLNNRSFFAAILHRSAWLIIAGLFVATITTTTTAAVLFADGFEGYTRGVGVNGVEPSAYPGMTWDAVDTTVTNSPVNDGTNALALTSADASAVQTFADAQTNVWMHLYLKPVIGDTADVTNPPLGSAYAFYVNSSSNVHAFSWGS